MPWLLAALLAFAIQLPFFDRWFSFMDEGHILQFADLISRGGELYRDGTVYPLPGAFWLLAAAFRVVEPSILVARWIVVVEYTLFVLLVLLWLRRLLSPPWLLLAFVLLLLYRFWSFPHWQMYSYSTTAMLVLLTALLSLVRFLETRRKAWLALAGFWFGLGVLCKQDYGAAALLAVCIVLPVYARASGRKEALLALFAIFLGPAALVGGVTGLHFLREGFLADVLRLTVANHFVGIASYEYPAFPDLFPLFGQDSALRVDRGRAQYMPALLFTADWPGLRESWFYRETALYDLALKIFYYAPWPIVLAATLRLVRRRATLGQPAARPAYLAELLLVAFAASLTLLVTLNRPQDYVHLIVLYWPLLAIGIVLVRAALAGRPRLAALVVPALALCVGGVALYTARLIERFIMHHSAPIELARAGVRVRPVEARLLEAVVHHVRANTAPDEPIGVIPYYPIVHFLSERPAPHRSSYIVWPFPELPDRDRQIAAAMDAQGTRVVIYNFTQFAVFPTFEEFAPALFDYLVAHYDLERVFSYDLDGYALAALRRRAGPPEGRPLPQLSEIGVRIESPIGPPRPIVPGERAGVAALEPWPFRSALALRPSARGGRTVATLALDVPAGARLRTAVAVNPQLWHFDPVEVHFGLDLEAGGRRETLYERRLMPATRLEDRAWFEVEVPLGPWAGRHVALEFSTRVDAPAGERLRMAGWAEPRLVGPPAPDPR